MSREKRSVKPPPLPSPSAVRRLFASLMDQMFVLTFFTFALVLTANLMDGFSTGFSLKVFQNFSNPAFVRLATLEFAVLWVLYFGIGVGVLDATFGMWVWGVRVSYGPKGDSGYALRKAMRVFWSVLFFAPVVPMFLLAIKRRGRNLLDTLSGSNLYLSPQ